MTTGLFTIGGVTAPRHVLLGDGRLVTMRRAEAADRAAIIALYDGLSPRSRHQRFFHPTPRLTEQLRDLLTDLHRSEVWLAFDGETCVGESRVSPYPGQDRADLAITVADGYQGAGLGRALVRLATTERRDRRQPLTVTILPDNTAAVRLFRRVHATLRFDGGVLEGSIPQEVPTVSKPDPKRERLAAIPLFRACSDDQLRTLATLTTELDVARGTVLCREGEVGREWFVVDEGAATVSITGDEVAMIGRGGFFGELSLLDGEPRTATVTAATDMRLFVMSGPEFTQLLSDFPLVSRRILRDVGARLRVADSRLALTA
jgi:ribosomal protein S18 acetylase RimI-like enzyme